MHLLAQAATATATAVAQKTAEDPKWTEVAGFWATLAGVIVTFGAVMVALFGPAWHARRKAPKLSLKPEDGDITIPNESADSTFSPVRLLIHNAAGRETAHDVQVFVSVERSTSPGTTWIYAEDEPLRFDNPRRKVAQTTATVPSGYARPVWFAVAGAASSTAQAMGKVHAANLPHSRGVLSAVVANESDDSDAVVLEPNQRYNVSFVITGSNFDALYYSGVFGIHGESIDMPEGTGTRTVEALTFGWQHDPKLVSAPK